MWFFFIHFVGGPTGPSNIEICVLPGLSFHQLYKAENKNLSPFLKNLCGESSGTKGIFFFFFVKTPLKGSFLPKLPLIVTAKHKCSRSRQPLAGKNSFLLLPMFSHCSLNDFFFFYVFVVQLSCPTLCDPMDCSTPGFPVIHYLPEFAQTHVH